MKFKTNVREKRASIKCTPIRLMTSAAEGYLAGKWRRFDISVDIRIQTVSKSVRAQLGAIMDVNLNIRV